MFFICTGEHEDLVMSKMTYVGPGQGFVCTDCSYVADKKGNMRQHIESKHLDLSYPCSICGKQYKTYKTWYQHQKIH